MANQPTKYRKFLAGAATASLVATAVVPSAFAATFKDVAENNSHKEHIDALSAAGIINGYEDGSFGPNQSITRGQVVKMMGKWLVSLGYEVPADYATKQRFDDISLTTKDVELLKYAALVKDNGVFNGSNGKLDPSTNISRENMALVLVRAFDTINGTDLVDYVSKQEFKKDVSDRNAAKAEARPYIDVLDFFDITNPAAPAFNPKGDVTRGQFASFLNKTIKTDAPELNVVSVSAINPTTLTLTGTSLKNLKAEDVTIDGLKVESVTPSTDGKTSTVKLAGPMIQGDSYKVSVKVGEETKEFTVEFNYDITKVTLIETAYDDDTANQALKLRINNETVEANYNDLLQLGYDVQFVAVDKNGAVANIFQTTNNKSITGLLASNVPTGEYEVEVIVTLDNKFVVSDKGVITVKDIEGLATSVKNATFTNNGNTAQLSTTLIENEVLTLSRVVGDYAGKNDVQIPYGKYKVTSSNPAVLSVADTGTAFAMTANAPGTATITIDANGQVKQFTYTVKDNTADTVRYLNKAALQSNAMKFFVDAPTAESRTYYIDGADQYTDGNEIDFSEIEAVIPVDGRNSPLVSVSYLDETGAAVTATGTPIAAIEVTPLAVGKGSVILKNKLTGKELSRFTVDNTTSDATPYTTAVWFDAYSVSRDYKLALGTPDNKLTVNLVQLTKDGYHKENLSEGTGAGNYKVTVADDDVVTVDTTADDALTFTAVGAGSTEVLLTDAVTGSTIQRFTITVSSTSYTATDVKWTSNTTVVATGEAISVEDVLDVRPDAGDSIIYGIEHSYPTGAKVRIDDKPNSDVAGSYTASTSESAIVYIDANNDGLFDATKDSYLGHLSANQLSGFVTGGTAVPTAASIDVIGTTLYTTGNKDAGTILFKLVNEKTNKTVSSTTISVNVK